jgi:hypothetical protein
MISQRDLDYCFVVHIFQKLLRQLYARAPQAPELQRVPVHSSRTGDRKDSFETRKKEEV